MNNPGWGSGAVLICFRVTFQEAEFSGRIPNHAAVLTEYARRSARDRGEVFGANIRTKPALKVSFKVNGPSYPEFFGKTRVILP